MEPVPQLPSLVYVPFWNRSWKQGAAVAAWLAVNSILFPEPKSDESWMMHGVLVEQLWAAERPRTSLYAKRPPGTVAGLHLVAVVCLFLHGLSWRLDRYITSFRERVQDMREKQSFWKHLLSGPSGEEREEKVPR